MHNYCFHGPITDEVQSNTKDLKPAPAPKDAAQADADQSYLGAFQRTPESWMAGNAPEILETTWRYSRLPGPGSEMQMLGNGYNPDLPRKFTRLHLFDVAGARVLRADALCYQWNYKYNCQMVRREAADQNLESAFAAIYEPYADEPFILERQLLPIPGNENDALKAVAVQLKTRNGQTDICFADGRPEKQREVAAQGVAPLRVAGEFAYCSTDNQGLRQAVLTGGTLLSTPQVELKVARREYTGRVTAVDYQRKTLTIDAPWPAALAGGIFEIGTPNRTTSYTSATVKPQAGRTVITVTSGADYFRSRVTKVDATTGIITCELRPSLGRLGGLERDFVASNDAQTKFWRAEVLAEGGFKLTPSTGSGQAGAPVAEADFGEEHVLRLWEYGVGDTVRQSTWASVRRLEPGIFAVEGNADLTVSLPARSLEVSR
jgi:hypothetical protein